MIRHPDWRTHLYRYFAEAGRRPFSWGTWDCTHFAAGAVEAMTGDALPRIAGRYTTAIGAGRALRRAGFADVADLAASLLPKVVVDRRRGRAGPRYAAEGDVAVMVDDNGRLALGIIGRGVVHCLSPGVGLWASSDAPVDGYAVPFDETEDAAFRGAMWEVEG